MSDTQMSMLLGLAFAAFYAIATLPVGYLVDRYDPGDLEIAGKAGIAGDDASAVYFQTSHECEIPFGWRGHFARRARFGVKRKPCAAIGSKKNLR